MPVPSEHGDSGSPGGVLKAGPCGCEPGNASYQELEEAGRAASRGLEGREALASGRTHFCGCELPSGPRKPWCACLLCSIPTVSFGKAAHAAGTTGWIMALASLVSPAHTHSMV